MSNYADLANSPANEDFEDAVTMVARQLDMIGLRNLNDENAASPSLSGSIGSQDTHDAPGRRSDGIGSDGSDGEFGEDEDWRRRSLTGDGGRRIPGEYGGCKAIIPPQRPHVVFLVHRDRPSPAQPARPARGFDDHYLLDRDIIIPPSDAALGYCYRSRRPSIRQRSISPRPNPGYRRSGSPPPPIPPRGPRPALPQLPEPYRQSLLQHNTNISAAGGFGGGEEDELEENHADTWSVGEEKETGEKRDAAWRHSASFMSLPSILKPSTYYKKNRVERAQQEQVEELVQHVDSLDGSERISWLTDELAQEKIKKSPKLKQLFSWALDDDDESSVDDGGARLSNMELLARAEGHVRAWEVWRGPDDPIARELPVELVKKLKERMTKQEFEDPISVAKSPLRMHPC